LSVGLALIIIVISIGLFTYIKANQIPTGNAHAPLQANDANATAQANNASATSQADNATGVAQTATAIRQANLPTPTSPNPVLVPTPTHSPTATPPSILVNVDAVSDWQDSGVSVSQGMSVTITYVTGYWRPWPGVNFDGKGCTQGCDPVTHNLIVGCDHGGLIERIGSSQMICILNGATVTATELGELYLRINDDKQDDDSGAITVRITLG
jgi:hypothetical protein